MGDARHLGRAGGAGSDIWIVRMTTIAPESSTVKRALSAHAAIGLLAGALLYIVSLSGTLAVFYQEFQRIEQPRAPEMASIDPQAVQRGVEAVLAREKGNTLATPLYVHLPVEGMTRTFINTERQARQIHRTAHDAR